MPALPVLIIRGLLNAYALPLRTKEVDILYLVQYFLLALLAYMESPAAHVTLTFMSFCCIRIQFFRRIPSLKALNEKCLMNDIPSICIMLTLSPNSTDFVSLPLTIGRTDYRSTLTMRSLTFLPSNSSFSCTRTFLMMERRFW